MKSLSSPALAHDPVNPLLPLARRLVALSASLLAACSAGPVPLSEFAPAEASILMGNAHTGDYPGRHLEDLAVRLELHSFRDDCPPLSSSATMTLNGRPMTRSRLTPCMSWKMGSAGSRSRFRVRLECLALCPPGAT